MGYPRRCLVNPDAPGCYHCISRCVRRAFLCGGRYEHRRRWIEDGIALLAGIFAIEVRFNSVMSNHMHMELYVDPLRPRKWSATEIVDRWARLFPQCIAKVRQEAASPQEARRGMTGGDDGDGAGHLRRGIRSPLTTGPRYVRSRERLEGCPQGERRES